MRKFFHLRKIYRTGNIQEILSSRYVNLSARCLINFLHYSSSITIIFGVFFFFDSPNISLISRFPEELIAAAFFFIFTGAGVFTMGVTSWQN